MPCLVALLALISPRLALFALWLFSDVLSDAFDDWIVPALGFVLLPWTTLAYAVMWVAGTDRVYGFEWFIVVLAAASFALSLYWTDASPSWAFFSPTTRAWELAAGALLAVGRGPTRCEARRGAS